MKFENYLLEIESKENKKIRENICLHEVSPIIKLIYLDLKKRCYRKLTKQVLNKLYVPYQTLYSWVIGQNPIPISKARELLKAWKKYCKKSEEEFNEKWNLLYEINKGYSQNGQRKVILPKEMNEDLAYIMGFFQGDGHLAKKKLEGFQEYSIHFYESNVEVLNRINKLFQKYFNILGRIYYNSDKIGEWYTLRICSKPIYLFFENILNLRSGKKVRNIEVPKIIKKSKLSFQLSFIKGFFDAEGGIGETKKNPWLEIGQASKEKPCEILFWIRKKLLEQGISFSEPKRSQKQEFFRIRVSKRETIKRFFETISSEHPEKIIKFNNIINR